MTTSRGKGLHVPKYMRVAMTREPGSARIETMPVPDILAGDILVRTAVVGVCAGDTAAWYVERKVPAVLGHEPAGTVVHVGDKVKAFAPGDRVFFHHHAPCLRCAQCRRGQHTLCATWRKSRLEPGALAEYVRVPAENLVDTLRLPDEVGFEDAALLEPLACCVKAYRRLALLPGESVAVIGLGSMGQLLAALARAKGAHPVIGMDLVDYRRERALELTCDHVLDPEAGDMPAALREVNGGQLADVVLVGPGDVNAMKLGLSLTAPGGRWCCFWPTPPGKDLPISTHDLYFDEITLHFSYSCGPDDTAEALEWLRRGVVRARELVTHRFPLDRVSEAFALTREAGTSLKALVVVDEAAT